MTGSLPYSQVALAWLGCSIALAVFWWQQVRTSNANLVDVAWAAAIGTVAVAYAWMGSGPPLTRLVIALLPAMWAARLAAHIGRRALHAPEDSRYRYLRSYWTQHTQTRFFLFYQVQALTVLIFSFQFFVLANLPTPRPVWAIGLTIVIWAVAVSGEGISDLQLSTWRDDPTHYGNTCRSGLWRYSRHPNYFFEWLHWWSYVPLAIGTPWWWLPLLAQALMLFTLLRVTGIPHAERQALARRGDDYRDYQATTSAFFPWFPKKKPQ